MPPLAQITAAGVRLEVMPGGRLRATGVITDEIDALIRAHKPEILAELEARHAASDMVPNSVIATCAANDISADPNASRKARALAMLGEHPELRVAIVAEPGDPARVAIAIRDVGVGELEISADRYDPFAILRLMDEHRCICTDEAPAVTQSATTVH